MTTLRVPFNQLWVDQAQLRRTREEWVSTYIATHSYETAPYHVFDPISSMESSSHDEEAEPLAKPQSKLLEKTRDYSFALTEEKNDLASGAPSPKPIIDYLQGF